MLVDRREYGSENYVCPRCFKCLEECECAIYPPHYLVMIDKAMQRIIYILNKKGYITMGCCEGHYGEEAQSVHIVFNHQYSFNIPDGFEFVKNKRGIAHALDGKLSKEDWNLDKNKHIKILEEWADGLPYLTKDHS